jgi:hypothetical protein
VTVELNTSRGKDGKTKEEVREEDGAEDEDNAGEDDVETTVEEVEAPRIKPGTPPGDRSRIVQSASIRLSRDSLGAPQAANGRVVTGGEGTVGPPPCDVGLLEFDLMVSVGGLTLTVTPGSSSMSVE